MIIILKRIIVTMVAIVIIVVIMKLMIIVIIIIMLLIQHNTLLVISTRMLIIRQAGLSARRLAAGPEACGQEGRQARAGEAAGRGEGFNRTSTNPLENNRAICFTLQSHVLFMEASPLFRRGERVIRA